MSNELLPRWLKSAPRPVRITLAFGVEIGLALGLAALLPGPAPTHAQAANVVSGNLSTLGGEPRPAVKNELPSVYADAGKRFLDSIKE